MTVQCPKCACGRCCKLDPTWKWCVNLSRNFVCVLLIWWNTLDVRISLSHARICKTHFVSHRFEVHMNTKMCTWTYDMLQPFWPIKWEREKKSICKYIDEIYLFDISWIFGWKQEFPFNHYVFLTNYCYTWNISMVLQICDQLLTKSTVFKSDSIHENSENNASNVMFRFVKSSPGFNPILSMLHDIVLTNGACIVMLFSPF